MKINRCCIIGGGASVRENRWGLSIDKLSLWSALKNEFTIGTNFSYKFFDSTILMYSDYHWYGANKKDLKNVSLILGKKDGEYQRKEGIRTDSNVMLLKEAECKKKLIWGEKEEGMHPHHWGKDAWTKGWYTSQLTGIKALNLAIALECKEICLLGFDATEINGHTHFYDDTNVGKYKWKTSVHNGVGKDKNGNYRTGNYNKINELNFLWFQPFEQELKNEIKIYNVSLKSKIDTFPKISYKDFYEILKTESCNVNHDNIRKMIKNKLRSSS